MTRETLICLVALLSLSATSGLRWTDTIADGQTITSCVGDDVVFPWDFKPGHNDVIFSIDWFIETPVQEMVAFYSRGTFVPAPDYNGRVEYAAHGGLVLRHVTENDKGNYSMEIVGHDSAGTSFTVIRSADLQVLAPTNAADYTLPLTKSPQPVHDDVTGKWSLQLSCGNFSLTGQPPFAVEWTTPSGSVVNSTSYKDGQFHLKLPGQLEKGTYSCHIPAQYAGKNCLPHNLTGVHNTSAVIDNTEARLVLLDAAQDNLRQENTLLKMENKDMKQRLERVENCSQCSGHNNNNINNTISNPSPMTNASITSTGSVSLQAVQNLTSTVEAQATQVKHLNQLVTQQAHEAQNLAKDVDTLKRGSLQSSSEMGVLQGHLAHLNGSAGQLNTSLESLKTEMHLLEQMVIQDKATLTQSLTSVQNQLTQHKGVKPKVSFHAQLARNVMSSSGQTLVLTLVYNNDGNAYANDTGVFTAPHNGTYFFIASTGSYSESKDASLEIVVEGNQLSGAYAHRHNNTSEMATCHGVTALTAGERVWLVSMLDSYFNYADTFFSGFLLSMA